MLAGNKTECGIEIEITDVIGDWAQGTFLLWVHGVPIGDQSDRFVHVQGCINWLKDFIEHPRDRFEATLFALPKEEVYRLLSTNEDSLPPSSPTGKQIDRAFSRFHISHLGMSSFDQVTLLLMEDERRRQRLIWQQASGAVKEAYLPPGRMQLVASECVEKAASMLNLL
jgi:hypothetical protein